LNIENKGFSELEIQELTKPIGVPLSGELSPDMQKAQKEDIPVNPAFEPLQPKTPDMNIQIWPKGSRLPHWATGYMYGYSYTSEGPFFGYNTHAGMGIQQSLGRYWTLKEGVGFNKYSIYYNNAKFDGSVT
jgi:hypothetical protein